MAVKNLLFVLSVSILGSSAFAQTTCSYDYFGNITCSDGGGWTKDYFGNIQGTGKNSGGGYTTDYFANIQGTGNNSGTSCIYDYFGNLTCY